MYVHVYMYRMREGTCTEGVVEGGSVTEVSMIEGFVHLIF
jgi:hypothetical protein